VTIFQEVLANQIIEVSSFAIPKVLCKSTCAKSELSGISEVEVT
jgi:hypothetical protein